jgi:hypothetical protein
MNVKIEKGIPLAEKGKRGLTSEGLSATLRAMEVGDSFALGKGIKPTSVRVLSGSPYVPGKFSVRKTADGYRCWRIE